MEDSATSIGHGNGIDCQSGYNLGHHSDRDGQHKSVIVGGACHWNRDRTDFIDIPSIVCQSVMQFRTIHRGRTAENTVVICYCGRPQNIALWEQICQIVGLGYTISAGRICGCYSSVSRFRNDQRHFFTVGGGVIVISCYASFNLVCPSIDGQASA